MTTDMAWAAGLFEGEGSIYLQYNRYLQLNLCTKDKDVLDRFAGIVGGSVKPKKSPTKPFWQWQLCGVRAERALKMMMLQFGERRLAKACDVLGTRFELVEAGLVRRERPTVNQLSFDADR